MPQDLAFAVWETLVPDRAAKLDRSGEHRCLDIGCAMGWFVRHMRRRGVESFGVDYSTYALAQAPDDVTGHLHWHDLRTGDPTFYGGGFSIVSCFETLEHIDEAHVEAALACIAASLAPDGRAVLTICTDAQPGWNSDPTHVTIKARAWWAAALDRAGFWSDTTAEARLRSFWLFSTHDGVFVVGRSG